MNEEFFASLELFPGTLSPTLGHLHARLPPPDNSGTWTLRGRARGPFSQYAHTLPMNYSFQDLGSGPSIMARCVIPEPTLWSRELGSTYEVSLELLRAGEVIAKIKLPFGLRDSGASGDGFRLNGKRTVLRGVAVASEAIREAELFRDSNTCAVVRTASDNDLSLASNHGTLVIYRLDARHCDVPQELRRLSRNSCVVVVLIENGDHESFECASRNLVLAQWLRQHESLRADWASAIVVTEEQARSLAKTQARERLPIFVARTLAEEFSIAQARHECDVLQAQLAALGQYAGYLILNDQSHGSN